MKTSNKILAGFFLTVFLVPVFMFMAFKSKIRKGEFSIVKREAFGDADVKSGTFNEYKVVKLSGIPGKALRVNLNYADSVHYSYAAGSEDSIRIYNSADTVFIQYTGEQSRSEDYSMSNLYVDLSLPALEYLIVDNAEATIYSVDSSGNKNMNVEIMGASSLNIGRPAENNEDPGPGDPMPVKLNQLSVKSTNGSLYLGNNVNIRQMILQAEGASTITIKEAAVIDKIQGNLSDSSSVNASWKYLKRLAELPQQ